jgi:O-antigen ligase
LKKLILDNQQFIVIGSLWTICGIFAPMLSYVVIPVMLLMMYKKEMHLEILLGFFLILTLSDSRSYNLAFAGNIKNVYILMISLFSYLEMKIDYRRIDFYKHFIPFFLISIVCVFFNPNMFLSFQKVLSYILLLCFVPNYFLFVYQKYGNTLLRSIVFLVCMVLFIGLVFNFSGSQLTVLIGRYRGLLGNPNGLGLYVFLFFIFFSVVNDQNPELFSRNEKIIVYALCFYSLLKCGARTSLASSLIYFFFKRFYKLSPILGFLIFIATAITYQYVSDNLTEIITSLGLGEELRVNTLENGSGRAIAWKFAWEQINENFYLGNGFSYTEFIYRKNYEYLSMLGHEGAAHNSYLTFWLDVGIIGLIFYLIGLLLTFLKAAKLNRVSIPILYAILFSNQYESWLTASLNPFTIQFVFTLSFIFAFNLDNEEKLAL